LLEEKQLHVHDNEGQLKLTYRAAESKEGGWFDIQLGTAHKWLASS
jgi:hypothetical protein